LLQYVVQADGGRRLVRVGSFEVGDEDMRMTATLLHGSHPSFPSAELAVTGKPAKKDHVALWSPDGSLVDLYPLATYDICTQCGHPEVYLYSAMRDGHATFRGYQDDHVFSSEALDRAMAAFLDRANQAGGPT
jgi:hypothetical protein